MDNALTEMGTSEMSGICKEDDNAAGCLQHMELQLSRGQRETRV